MVHNLNVSAEPNDRLTRLADQMSQAIDTPENDDVQTIIFLTAGDRGGIQLSGWEDPIEAMAQLLIHISAVFQSQGKQFGVMTDNGVMILGGEESSSD